MPDINSQKSTKRATENQTIFSENAAPRFLRFSQRLGGLSGRTKKIGILVVLILGASIGALYVLSHRSNNRQIQEQSLGDSALVSIQAANHRQAVNQHIKDTVDLISAQPEDYKNYLILAQLYEEDGQYIRAEENYERVLSMLDPNMPDYVEIASSVKRKTDEISSKL